MSKGNYYSDLHNECLKDISVYAIFNQYRLKMIGHYF